MPLRQRGARAIVVCHAYLMLLRFALRRRVTLICRAYYARVIRKDAPLYAAAAVERPPEPAHAAVSRAATRATLRDMCRSCHIDTLDVSRLIFFCSTRAFAAPLRYHATRCFRRYRAQLDFIRLLERHAQHDAALCAATIAHLIIDAAPYA